MSDRSAPVADPHGLDRARLLARCTEALRLGPAGGGRAGAAPAAGRLGGEAADAGTDLRDLVTGFLTAAAGLWAGAPPTPPDTADEVHRRAGRLLGAVEACLAAAVDGYRDRARAELTRHDAGRRQFIDDLLSGRGDLGGLAERAHRYGIRLSATHTATVARGDGVTAAVARRIDAALAARFGDGNVLVCRRGDDLVCLSAGTLRGVAAELAHHLATALGTGSWQVAVGRPHPGLHGIASSLDEAVNALDLADRLGFAVPVLQAADLLVFPVLLRDRDAITDLVTSVLGPLAGARGGPGPYLSTLEALFESQGNYAATARALHLSVRAVTYRLDRIRALTGYHPAEPTQRFTLQAAVLGARLLGWPADAGGTGPG